VRPLMPLPIPKTSAGFRGKGLEMENQGAAGDP